MSLRYVGLDGEATARDYIVGIGGEVIAANVKLAGGEIDIIARIDGVYAFIEVKRRSSRAFGAPAEAVTPAKQRRIIRAAKMYCALNGLMDESLRFDIIELLPGYVNHIESAFDATGY